MPERVKEGKHGYKLSDGTWECRYCGEILNHAGHLNFHVGSTHKQESAPPPAATNQSLPAGCNHRWRRLAGNDPSEAEAIGTGWTHVCTACDELGARQGTDILTDEDMAS